MLKMTTKPLLVVMLVVVGAYQVAAGEGMQPLNDYERSLKWHVVKDNVPVFKTNFAGLQIVRTFRTGDEIRPLQAWQDWYLIELDNSTSGWINKQEVSGFQAQYFPVVGTSAAESTPNIPVTSGGIPEMKETAIIGKNDQTAMPSGVFVLNKDVSFELIANRELKQSFEEGQIVNTTAKRIGQNGQTEYCVQPVIGGRVARWEAWVVQQNLSPVSANNIQDLLDASKKNTTQQQIPREPRLDEYIQ